MRILMLNKHKKSIEIGYKLLSKADTASEAAEYIDYIYKAKKVVEKLEKTEGMAPAPATPKVPLVNKVAHAAGAKVGRSKINVAESFKQGYASGRAYG